MCGLAASGARRNRWPGISSAGWACSVSSAAEAAGRESGRGEVRQALEFILELNQSRELAQRAVLQPASEACFSGAAHLELIDRRVARLEERMDDSTAIDREAREFVRDHLQPAWQHYAPL